MFAPALVVRSHAHPAQGIPREPVTRSYVVAFERADHWALRGIVLTSLGDSWQHLEMKQVARAGQ